MAIIKSKVDIGIIGALDEEVQGLIALIKHHKVQRCGLFEFHLGYIGACRVAVTKCGVGKVFAAAVAEAMIIRYSPALIVNSGVAGGISPELHVSDIVIADALVQHDMDTTPLGDRKGLISGINVIEFETDAKTNAALSVHAETLGLCVKRGVIATGDTFVASKEQKERIAQEFGAVACEMEGCAIAQVAYVNDTPCAVIRSISDSADESSGMDYATFMPIAASNSVALTAELIKYFKT